MSENILNLRATEKAQSNVSDPSSRAEVLDGGTINILIVDDEKKNLTVLETILDDPSYRLVRAESADQALLALLEKEFALLILDVRMPGVTGFELAQMIKARKKTSLVPIIFLTAYYNEDQHVIEGYSAGAVDYLHKPVNSVILRSKVAIFAELHRKSHEIGTANAALLSEVTERRRAEMKLCELNETLEQCVAERTEALRESTIRLSHACEIARLTYISIDYTGNRAYPADNFAGIMGFALPRLSQGEVDFDVSRQFLLDHIVPADRAQCEAELAPAIGPPHRKIAFRILGDDQIERWIESLRVTEFSSDGTPLHATIVYLDITDLKQAEEQKQILMAEVNHRGKNLLAVVQAIAHHTARHADPVTFAMSLSDRIGALAANQDLLIKNDWHGIEASDLVRAQLSHFKDLIGLRILIEGPSARLTATAAQALSMALYELATNAAKYGALSNRGGCVRISWSIVDMEQPIFAIQWVEEGGPKVLTPTRMGFGQMVIGPMAESAVDGQVEIEFLDTGFSWKLSALVADILEPGMK